MIQIVFNSIFGISGFIFQGDCVKGESHVGGDALGMFI